MKKNIVYSEVRKWGNSSGILLSKKIIHLSYFEIGDKVVIECSPNKIVITKV